MLSISDKIAIVNTVATILLSITTIVLSVFVYGATKKAADAAEKTVNLTEESLKLNRKIQEMQAAEAEKLRNGLRMQYVDVLYKKCEQIRLSVTSMDAQEIHRSLSAIDYNHHVKPETLAFCFSTEELHVIKKAWSALDYYLNSYYRKTYKGSEMGLLVTNAHIPISAFEELKGLLESIRTA
ncbi:hypothetical protein [Paenibacillus ihbetae]|uniref:Uncharacterized protein n=1 Tax=Paenibacillus ihbetae TaxID=1870820 RepID=A0ABX3JSV3_9BACL|nr:hypothetical protein [Paenibacillus ihbetae]OOC59059.1 hypothetical protein BBD40_25765 [Paenibacillus ihbetae]